MIDLQAYLETKVKSIISTWEADDIYAISFFVYSNEAFEYKEYSEESPFIYKEHSNVTEFQISYNTEKDCKNAGEFSEERWNYAFWNQNTTPIIDTYGNDEGIKTLFEWYKEKGITNIGYEDPDSCYDSNCRYIGKGPIGYYELLLEITEVAKKLQESGFVKNKFNKPIPIIIHELEYCWYVIEASKKANPNGEADVFLTAMKELGMSPE